MNAIAGGGITDQIGTNLPFLRRYARALTGSQDSGDKYAMATLEAVLANTDVYPTDTDPREALFRVFHMLWNSTGTPIDITSRDTGLADRAHSHLSMLTPNSREALLLQTVEDFPIPAVARIMNETEDTARELITIAYAEMAKAIKGKVMVIEDEALIAIDLEAIVADMGHQVTGVARTETGAIDLAKAERPDLILSDIQLADNSSGISAVNKILASGVDCPVVFITAYPERLLTGEGPEPAFLISKPYTEEQVRSAVSQAMFFASTETLKA